MQISPLVERDLRYALQRGWPHRLRFGAGLASCLWIYFAYSTSDLGTASLSPGRWVFHTTSIAILVLCGLVGPIMTSRAFHYDRQSRMLDLLLITKTGAFGIVFSRFSTHSNPIIQVIVGLLPALSLPLALGGVSFLEVFRIALLSIVTLLFSAAVGLYASSFFRSARHAIITTCLVLFLATLGSNEIDRTLTRPTDIPHLPGIIQAFQFSRNSSPEPIPLGLATTLECLTVATVGLIALATIRLPYSVQLTATAASRGRANRPSPRTTTPKQRRRARNPVDRLAARRQWSPARISILLVTMTLLILWAILSHSRLHLASNHLLLLLIPIGVHGITKIMLLIKTSLLIADARNSGEMEILLSTPLSVSQIYAGFRAAILRSLRVPLVLVLMIDLATALLSTRYASSPSSDRIVWLVIWGLIVMLAIDLWTSIWVGLWEGSRNERSNRAAIRTLVKTILIPSLVFVLTLGFSPFLSFSANAVGGDSIYIGAIIWFWIVGLATKTPAAVHAQRALQRHFRPAIANDLEPRRSRARIPWRFPPN